MMKTFTVIGKFDFAGIIVCTSECCIVWYRLEGLMVQCLYSFPPFLSFCRDSALLSVLVNAVLFGLDELMVQCLHSFPPILSFCRGSIAAAERLKQLVIFSHLFPPSPLNAHLLLCIYR